ncbi:hypothetical protein [Methylomarinum vadi]|uniref:hypothetical protein n=1 Tax=Methylomarinum vadi TaxID=438855 RepID=UPI0004DF1ADC|nr:hypothetical protein [Methylomarinum vadi]
MKKDEFTSKALELINSDAFDITIDEKKKIIFELFENKYSKLSNEFYFNNEFLVYYSTVKSKRRFKPEYSPVRYYYLFDNDEIECLSCNYCYIIRTKSKDGNERQIQLHDMLRDNFELRAKDEIEILPILNNHPLKRVGSNNGLKVRIRVD